MRLIDADALREDLRRFFPAEVLEGIEPKTLFAQIMHDIDNAPTVEPQNQLVLRARDDAELEQLKTAWGNGEICFTPIVAYTARPHGEWITDDVTLSAWRCDKCLYATPSTYNFCPNCGADMRGGAE